MRVLYVAPRYHTNQTAIMKGWLSRGDKVGFLAHYAGKLEDYSAIKPEIVGYSIFFNLFNYLYVHIINRKKEYAVNMRLKGGFPPVFKLFRIMSRFQPDVVITRERSVYSIFVTLFCRLKGLPVILYNQSPVMEARKKDLVHRVLYSLTPEYRITPVYTIGKMSGERDKKAYFLPFLMEPQLAPEEKSYFHKDRINLFCIGKYQIRKNHLMMIEVVEKLAAKYPVHLVIAGEVSDVFQEKYYRKITEYVKSRNLEGTVELYRNLDRVQIFDIYKKSDLFVLASTDEPAAVSPLEAMAFSLPVISGNNNGTATYIEEGQNGYIFEDQNADDLYNKIELIISNKENIRLFGKKSYELVIQRHQFTNYYQTICGIVDKIREDSN